MDLPIVCTLTEAELRERRRTVLDSIRDSAIDVAETEEGYAFRFKPASDVLARLSHLVERNIGKGFDSAALDLRLSRKFQITERATMELMVESFNVLNRTTLQFPNNAWGTGTTPPASFGRATAASDPRQMQFGLRLKL